MYAHMHEIKVCSTPFSTAAALTRKTRVSFCGRIADIMYRNGSLKNTLTYSVNEAKTSVKVEPDMMDSNFSFE